jgi:hypothetical protein
LLRLINEAHDGPWQPVPIKRRQLQALSLGQLREISLRHRPGERKFSASAGYVGPPRQGPQPVPRAVLEEVAAIYENECDERRNPTGAIQRRFGVSPMTVQKYVRLCRKEKLLGWPTRLGVPGYSADSPPPYQHGSSGRSRTKRV